MHRLLRLVSALAIAVGLYVATAPLTHASFCLPTDLHTAQRESDVVFVGTVVGVANQNRWATVSVEEIWSGLDLPAVVEVHGSEIVAQDVWTDIDRTFLAGRRYVFALDVQNARLRDHACTATLLWIDELDRFRPAVVRGPVGAVTPDPTMPEADAGRRRRRGGGGAWWRPRVRRDDDPAQEPRHTSRVGPLLDLRHSSTKPCRIRLNRAPGHAHTTRFEYRCYSGGSCPTNPSSDSRMRSAWPLWRAYSSIMLSRMYVIPSVRPTFSIA